MATAKGKKAVVKKETMEVANYNEVEGLEGIEQDMLIVPRMKLVQRTSEEVMENEYNPGSFCNSVTKEALGKALGKVKDGCVLSIIPVLIAPRSRIFFRAFDEGGGIYCSSKDGQTGTGIPGGNCRMCPKKDFQGDLPPECTDFINVFCMIDDYDLPIPLVIGFGKTSMGAGKKLVNFLVMKNQSPWNFKFEIKSSFVDSEKGEHFVMKLNPDGFASDEQKLRGKAFYDMLKQTQYEVHTEEEQPTTKDEGEDDSTELPGKVGKEDDPF